MHRASDYFECQFRGTVDRTGVSKTERMLLGAQGRKIPGAASNVEFACLH